MQLLKMLEQTCSNVFFSQKVLVAFGTTRDALQRVCVVPCRLENKIDVYFTNICRFIIIYYNLSIINIDIDFPRTCNFGC